MYNLLRKVHLYVGLSLLAFILMYFITGYVMIHHDLIESKDPEKTVRVEPLTGTAGLDADEVIIYLQNKFDIPGKRWSSNRMDDGRWRFNYFHPGHNYNAIISANGDSVEITHVKQDTRRLLIGFHRLHGYGGGWIYNIWAIMYDLASLAMILFPLTGIYMWYKLTQKRLFGWILLAISFTYALSTILYLVYAP